MASAASPDPFVRAIAFLDLMTLELQAEAESRLGARPAPVSNAGATSRYAEAPLCGADQGPAQWMRLECTAFKVLDRARHCRSSDCLIAIELAPFVANDDKMLDRMRAALRRCATTILSPDEERARLAQGASYFPWLLTNTRTAWEAVDCGTGRAIAATLKPGNAAGQYQLIARSR